jgi:hypothetical protein
MEDPVLDEAFMRRYRELAFLERRGLAMEPTLSYRSA